MNHALGIISLEAMELGLAAVSLIWRNPVGLSVLYGSLLCHLLLGLYALYDRKSFHGSRGELTQLILGIAIPALLMSHVVASRMATSVEGLEKGYTQLLYYLWTQDPAAGAIQLTALGVTWAHGCFGMYYWLRMKPWFSRVEPWLLSVAVLLPTLALIGYVEGGRAVNALSQNALWREINLGPDRVGWAYQIERLLAIRDSLLLTYGAMLGSVFVFRGIRSLANMKTGTIRLNYPNGRIIKIRKGTSVLEASRLHNIPHESVCGGRGRCSTCRVRVIDGLGGCSAPAPEPSELAVLGRIGAHAGIRLACQFRPECEITVAPLCSPSKLRQGAMRDREQFGEERFVVAMFVDMRGSTRLAESRLPFDTVFVINRFLSAVGQAVRASGGDVNQLLGDGLMALFGLNQDREGASRNALRAIDAIREQVESLNRWLAADFVEPIRYGVGVHAGLAIVGAMGDEIDSKFTALGDVINVAARLQSMTKAFECLAIISEAVFESAALPCEGTTELCIEGREGRLRAQLVGKLPDHSFTCLDGKLCSRPSVQRPSNVRKSPVLPAETKYAGQVAL
ncbi:adenylate/guanylate cyclase domain-containing protein [Bradyrhizobium sp. LTSPM299]|uniref:adenylate/guanylate cyclase domain-containing protein n=1 Tax=Bradyrhizobium sp. LTSPM299 TaxID=1619233 RepID=UPI001FD8F495|nr:adenylate/guanylate cyclase domain-containing protein [Bradyrhizobium sp. LTSPM299]